MDPEIEGHLSQAEQAAQGIADAATQEAVRQLIAAVRASTGTADYRSADLQ